MKYDISNAPELDWLKADSINGTPEGADVIGKEYKRTWCSIKLLNAVLNCDYEAFSGCQPESSRIFRSSFYDLCDWVNTILYNEESRYAMRAYLVINDLGKVRDFVKKVSESLGFESVDHDKILYEGLKAHPEFSPTFNSLSKYYQETILDGLKTSFNMGQYIQCECVPASLDSLYSLNEIALNYYLIHVLFDIAGAAGHVNDNGSLICNELYWNKFKIALETIYNLVEDRYLPRMAYLDYLKQTMDYYIIYDKDNYAVARICNMINVPTAKEAHDIENAFNELPIHVQCVLEKELMASGIGTDSAILLYYAPATFRNALSYYKKENKETAIKKTIMKIAPIMAYIFEQIRASVKLDKGVLTVFIADIAKSALDPENMPNSWKMVWIGNDVKVIPEE